jgi:hypothetical protein
LLDREISAFVAVEFFHQIAQIKDSEH